MKIKNNKLLIILLAGALLLIAGLIWWNNQWVMKVNGQRISKEEYAFYQKINPRLNEHDLQKKIVEEKVQLQQAEKQKIETILDYQTLKREMKQVNQDNEQKIKEHQVVYGLRKYDESSFYRYSYRTTINALEKKSIKKSTDKKLREYYQEHQSDFKEVDAKELYRVFGKQQTLEQLSKEAVSQEQLMTNSEITFERVALNERSLREWIKYREEELTEINDLSAGQWSGLFEKADKTWRYYCFSNKTGETQSFETVKEKITLHLEKEQYQAIVKKWVKQAKVEIK